MAKEVKKYEVKNGSRIELFDSIEEAEKRERELKFCKQVWGMIDVSVGYEKDVVFDFIHDNMDELYEMLKEMKGE